MLKLGESARNFRQGVFNLQNTAGTYGTLVVTRFVSNGIPLTRTVVIACTLDDTNPTVNDLDVSETLTDTFTVTATQTTGPGAGPQSAAVMFTIQGTNDPPPAIIVGSPHINADQGAVVTLDGSGSCDPEGATITTCAWEQPSGTPTVTLLNPGIQPATLRGLQALETQVPPAPWPQGAHCHPGHCVAFDTVLHFINGCRQSIFTAPGHASCFRFALATNGINRRTAMRFANLVKTVLPGSITPAASASPLPPMVSTAAPPCASRAWSKRSCRAPSRQPLPLRPCHQWHQPPHRHALCEPGQNGLAGLHHVSR